MKKIVIIGAGIVGLSIARELSKNGQKNITVIEKESNIAVHQSSRNSGVMHAGLYYKPGSLKAEFARRGIKLMKNYCRRNNISWNECGKVVVAVKRNETVELEKLLNNGEKNKLVGLRRLNRREINQIEPYLNAYEGIHVPEESIVNFKKVSESFLKELKTLSIKVKYNSKFINYKKENHEITLESGEKIEADIIISASGLYSDKVTKLLGLDINNQQIIPFRGEYYNFKDDFNHLVKGLIYPVPSPKLPFLGVHLTKTINGSIEAGPNAVLAMSREGYDWKQFDAEEIFESLSYPGLRNFILKYPLITLGEIFRSLSKKIFVRSLKTLIPEVEEDMLIKGNSGVRAQLMNTQGDLIQDFDIRVTSNIVSILNAPSPAATSSLAIAKYVVNFLDL